MEISRKMSLNINLKSRFSTLQYQFDISSFTVKFFEIEKVSNIYFLWIYMLEDIHNKSVTAPVASQCSGQP